MNEQVWFCLACNRCGSVIYESGCGAYAVLEKIRESHKRLSVDGRPAQCSQQPRIVSNMSGAVMVARPSLFEQIFGK